MDENAAIPTVDCNYPSSPLLAMTALAGAFPVWIAAVLLIVASTARSAEGEPLSYGLRDFTFSAWAQNQWRLLWRDARYRPKKLFAWRGTERTYVGDSENEPLQSDRPTFTQADTVVGLRRVQIESGYTYIRASDNAPFASVNSAPETLLRVGVLAEWLELRAGWSAGTNSAARNSAASIFSGAGQLYLGAKFALTDQAGWRPQMVILPQVRFSTVESNWNAGGVNPGINWLYGWKVNSWLTINGSTQVNRARDHTLRWYGRFAQSLVAGYQVSEKLELFTEWFAFFPAGSAVALPQHYGNTGFKYHVTPNLQLDMHLGGGLNAPADNGFIGSGIVARF